MLRWLPLCLAVVLSQLRASAAVTRGIAQDTFPWIVDLDTGRPYDWTSGRVAELLSSSPAVRVSSRGVRFVHRSQTLARGAVGSTLCRRDPDALCDVEGNSARVFPTHDGNILFMGAESLCSESFSGRTVTFAGPSDTTLCDVTSGNQHVILTASGHFLQKHSKINANTYLFISVLQVAIVGYIVHRLAVGSRPQAWGRWTTLGGVALALVSCLLAVFTHDSSGIYVTLEDFYALFFLLAYVLFHVGRWAYYAARFGQRAPCYGMLIGALNLLFFRVFATLDNPCTLVSLAFIEARVISKFTHQAMQQSVLRFADMLLDSVMIGVLGVYGVVPQYECSMHAWSHMLLLLCAVFAFVQEYYDSEKPTAG